MTTATLIHPLTTLLHPRSTRAGSGAPARRRPRTRLAGALVLVLAYALLAGSFLLDLARPVL